MTAVPVAALDGLVLGYAGFRESSDQPVVRRELPISELVLVLNLAEPLTVRRSSSAAAATAPAAFLAGVGHSSLTTGHAGHQVALEVRLSALAAGSLFGVSAGQLAEQVVDLTELWGRAGSELVERAATVSWRDSFGLVEAALLAQLSQAAGIDPVLAGAHRLLLERGGDLSVGELEKLTGWSRRRLAEQFREHVGLTPKAMARLVRFHRAAHLLQQPGHRSLVSIALSCGYYDQAHFNREFRELAACTPTAYLAQMRADTAGTGMSGNDGPGVDSGTDVQDHHGEELVASGHTTTRTQELTCTVN